MSTSRPFAYNPSPNPTISGTTQIGDIAIGVDPNLDYFGGAGGVQWWEGPDEDLGYIVAKPISLLNQPNPLSIPAGVAFGRSLFTEESFILLAESLSSGTTFTSGNDASTWLTSNGYWNTWVFISPTPTPTITQTQTPTSSSLLSTPTNTPTNTQTPTASSTPGSTPTNTPTPTETPAPTPAPQYYYMSPNSWAPPTISQGPSDNLLITDQTLSPTISTSDFDYTTTDWSFSVWAYPQFAYQSLPNGTNISTLLSLAIPAGGSNPGLLPDNTATNLTIGVEYTSGGTLVNDLVVWMTDDAGTYAKWTWAINSDNALITGISSGVMWDINNYGTTGNAQRFSNIVISHNESLVTSTPSLSTKAYWNGQLLTLKSYTAPGGYPHIGDYDSLLNTRFYLSVGGKLGNLVTNFLSINTDNPIYYPLYILSPSDVTTLYNGGVVLPSIPFTSGQAYIWNFDSTSALHLQCLDKNNTNVPDFVLLSYNNNTPNIITYTLV